MKDPMREHLIIKEPNCWEYILYNNKVQISLVILLCAFIGIGTPFIWREIWKIESDACLIESDLRYNCFPLKPTFTLNKTDCVNVKCCWDEFATKDQIQCYYGMVFKEEDKMPGYKIESSADNVSATLVVDIIPKYLNESNKDITDGPVVKHLLNLAVKHYSPSHFSVKISDKNETNNYDYTKFLNYQKLNEFKNNSESQAEIYFTQKPKDDFTIIVRRKKTNTHIFNTGQYSPFIFSEGLIEITTLLPNDMIFGLGQSPSKSFKHNMTYPQNWAIFNKQYLNLTINQTSWFGSHPFYLGLEGDGNAYGILLINTHPIEIITNSRPSLTYRTIGGYLEFHFFMGPKPMDVIRQLKTLIPKPSLPPYWALGFHLCRTTCDLKEAADVLKDMRNNSVPFESDCGSSGLSSVNSNNQINKIKEFFKNSKRDYGIHTTVVQVPQKLKYYDPKQKDANGKDIIQYDHIKDIYYRWKDYALINVTNEYNGYYYDYCGESSGITNKTVIYPNFASLPHNKENPAIPLKIDFELIGKFDGLILDYNTPLDLNYTTKNGNNSCQSYLDKNNWNRFFYSKLNEYTPCLDLKYPGIEDGPTHLSLHNLYGYQHMESSYQALKEYKGNLEHIERNLVMSSSTFIGSGYYGGHMGGSMNATWDMMKQTIVQTLEFNMYGIPLTGFPVCGFKGWPNSTELCLRWYQLASLQPFMISHRDFNEELTDPITVSKVGGKIEKRTLEAIRSAITIRYRLLPYLYTLFYFDHTKGEMVLRPMFFEYPDDVKTYRIDKQFFWGSALMISPITELGVKSVKAYFPKGNWYDFYSGRMIPNKNSQFIELSAIEYHINLHIRGGHVIPTQPSTNNTNTAESRSHPFTLIAALDTNNKAEGILFIDDGITEDYKSPNNQMIISKFYFENTNVTINSDINQWDSSNININTIDTTIDTIKIYGIIDPPCPQTFTITEDGTRKSTIYNTTYDVSLGVLTLKNFNIDLIDHVSYVFEWKFRDWNDLDHPDFCD